MNLAIMSITQKVLYKCFRYIISMKSWFETVLFVYFSLWLPYTLGYLHITLDELVFLIVLVIIYLLIENISGSTLLSLKNSRIYRVQIISISPGSRVSFIIYFILLCILKWECIYCNSSSLWQSFSSQLSLESFMNIVIFLWILLYLLLCLSLYSLKYPSMKIFNNILSLSCSN